MIKFLSCFLLEAVYLAQAQMERLRNASFSDLRSATFAGGKGSVTVTPALADLVSIKVELNWNPTKIPLRFYSLRSNY